MGFDKPDLGFVVHLGAPSSPIAYYQQVGRAGRSTASAEVILLPGREDQDVWRYFASVAFPSESHGAQRDSAPSNPIGRSRRPRWSRSSTSAGPGWRWC